MEFRARRSGWSFRTVVAGMLVVVGLMLTGCVGEYIRGIESSARDLRASDEFTAVNFEYQAEDPVTIRRSIYDYSAALHQDADLHQAGRLLAEAAQTAGVVPDIQVDDVTWVHGFQRGSSSRDTADFTAQQWTELLETARATQAQELEVWQLSDYEAEQSGDHEPKLLVTVRAETLTEGLAEYEQVKDLELPEGIEEVYVALQAGTDRQPWVYDMRSVGDRYHTNSDAPITILALPQANLLAARQLLDTAEARLGETSALNYHDAGTAATLDVAHSGEPQDCSEYEAYAQVARELITTDLELTVTLSYDENANGTGTPVYKKTLPEDTSIENSAQGCLAE